MTGKNVLATEYDENGNAVKETVRNGSGKETVIFHYLYEYYTDGKIRTKTKFALEGE